MTRRVFDDATGEHVTKPSTLADAEVFAPRFDPLAVKCPRCEAAPQKPCITLVTLVGKDREYPHPARVDLARSKS